MSSHPVPSAALVAANKRLHKLRTHVQSQAVAREPLLEDLTVDTQPEACCELPAHLGWHSEPVSRALRAQSGERSSEAPEAVFSAPNPPHVVQNSTKPALRADLSVDLSQSVKVYPDIALAMLRQEQTAAGRLWLLLRHMDVDGRGVLRVVNLRKTLTPSKPRHRLCGWRQLRNLLRQGEGVFWHRDKERVWLRSVGRVAIGLGVGQLNGRPVAIPVKHLLGTVGEARAYLYASFHAGRQAPAGKQGKQKPIARDTLTSLTGLTAACQRGYERRVGVRVSRNYVIGEPLSEENREERSWKQGGSSFEFVDYQGGQGKAGRGYIAWQLPNSYSVALAHRPKGRQKRINRMLSDLFMQGMTGNEQRSIEKRYFGDGACAAKALGKRDHAESELFWAQGGGGNGRLRLWYVLSGKQV